MDPRPLLALLLAAAACAGDPDRDLTSDAGTPADAAAVAPPDAAPPAPGDAAPTGWRLVHHETFDVPFAEPAEWVEDTYGSQSPYHVDAFDEDGEFFRERGGGAFQARLAGFRSFRKSFPHGEDGWLTVELYGRDSDRDGVPETGGRFVAENGRARLVSTRHYDGAIIRSTAPLPARYRVEVTVSDVRFGGRRDGAWTYDGRVNGYDGGDELGDPWRFTDASAAPLPAYPENGVYFLCITDYARPAPHNNVFIHHHRKVVMDTDSNMDEWSKVWDPVLGAPVTDGSRYVSLIWLRGDDFGDDWTGNRFLSHTPGGWHDGAVFADKYLEGETYVFAIERDGERYTLSVSGRFHHGGTTTYRASRGFREPPVTWHYNQTAAEYPEPDFDQTRVVLGETVHTWPAGSAYPDHFFFGDPHINYYEGTAEFDDVKLYVWEP